MIGKGWHRESMRHSEARLYGKASGNSVKSPSLKGNPKINKYNSASKVYKGKQVLIISEDKRKGQIGTVASCDSNLKTALVGFKDGKSGIYGFEKLDSPEKMPVESLSVPYSFSAIGSNRDVALLLDRKIKESGASSSDFEYSLTHEEDLGAGNSGMIKISGSKDKIDSLKKVLYS